LIVKAVFVELPPFERHREGYLNDEAFLRLQRLLMLNPEAGDVIPGTGGLRKLRFPDEKRGKGKRGGLRVIYYWWDSGSQFWLFTVFDKDEMSDLTAHERKAIKEMVKQELGARRKR
jgi:mRNA-degrading endonuclease RelE of RelBE toxin-antitoxin system